MDNLFQKKLSPMTFQVQKLIEKQRVLQQSLEAKQQSLGVVDNNLEQIQKIKEYLFQYKNTIDKENEYFKEKDDNKEKIAAMEEHLKKIESYFNNFDIDNIQKSKEIIEQIDICESNQKEFVTDLNKEKEIELIQAIEKSFNDIKQSIQPSDDPFEKDYSILQYNVLNQIKNWDEVKGYDYTQYSSIIKNQDISYLKTDPTIQVLQKINFLNSEERKDIYPNNKLIKNKLYQYLKNTMFSNQEDKDLIINPTISIDSYIKIQDKNVFESLGIDKEPFVQFGKIRNGILAQSKTDNYFLTVNKFYFEIETKTPQNEYEKKEFVFDLIKDRKDFYEDKTNTGDYVLTLKRLFDQLKLGSNTTNLRFTGIEANISREYTKPSTKFKKFYLNKEKIDAFLGSDQFTTEEKQRVINKYSHVFFEKANVDIDTFITSKPLSYNKKIKINDFISTAIGSNKDEQNFLNFRGRIYKLFNVYEPQTENKQFQAPKVLFKNSDVFLKPVLPKEQKNVETTVTRLYEFSLNEKLAELARHKIFNYTSEPNLGQSIQFDIETTSSGKIAEIGLAITNPSTKNVQKISILNSNITDFELQQTKSFKELGQYYTIADIISRLKAKQSINTKSIIKEIYEGNHVVYLQDLESQNFFGEITNDLLQNHSINVDQTQYFTGYNVESFDIPHLKQKIKDTNFKNLFFSQKPIYDLYRNGYIKVALAQKGIFANNNSQEAVQSYLDISANIQHVGQYDAETTATINKELGIASQQNTTFNKLINHFRAIYTKKIKTEEIDINGNQTEIIVIGDENNTYLKNYQIANGLSQITPEYNKFKIGTAIDSLIVFDGKSFVKTSLDDNIIEVSPKDEKNNEFIFKINKNLNISIPNTPLVKKRKRRIENTPIPSISTPSASVFNVAKDEKMLTIAKKITQAFDEPEEIKSNILLNDQIDQATKQFAYHFDIWEHKPKIKKTLYNKTKQNYAFNINKYVPIEVKNGYFGYRPPFFYQNSEIGDYYQSLSDYKYRYIECLQTIRLYNILPKEIKNEIELKRTVEFVGADIQEDQTEKNTIINFAKEVVGIAEENNKTIKEIIEKKIIELEENTKPKIVKTRLHSKSKSEPTAFTYVEEYQKLNIIKDFIENTKEEVYKEQEYMYTVPGMFKTRIDNAKRILFLYDLQLKSQRYDLWKEIETLSNQIEEYNKILHSTNKVENYNFLNVDNNKHQYKIGISMNSIQKRYSWFKKQESDYFQMIRSDIDYMQKKISENKVQIKTIESWLDQTNPDILKSIVNKHYKNFVEDVYSYSLSYKTYLKSKEIIGNELENNKAKIEILKKEKKYINETPDIVIYTGKQKLSKQQDPILFQEYVTKRNTEIDNQIQMLKTIQKSYTNINKDRENFLEEEENKIINALKNVRDSVIHSDKNEKKSYLEAMFKNDLFVDIFGTKDNQKEILDTFFKKDNFFFKEINDFIANKLYEYIYVPVKKNGLSQETNTIWDKQDIIEKELIKPTKYNKFYKKLKELIYKQSTDYEKGEELQVTKEIQFGEDRRQKIESTTIKPNYEELQKLYFDYKMQIEPDLFDNGTKFENSLKEFSTIVNNINAVIKPILEDKYQNDNLSNKKLSKLQQKIITLLANQKFNPLNFESDTFAESFQQHFIKIITQISNNKLIFSETISKIDFANLNINYFTKSKKLLSFIRNIIANPAAIEWNENINEQVKQKNINFLEIIKKTGIKSIKEFEDLQKVVFDIQKESEYNFTQYDFDNLPSFFLMDKMFNITQSSQIDGNIIITQSSQIDGNIIDKVNAFNQFGALFQQAKTGKKKLIQKIDSNGKVHFTKKTNDLFLLLTETHENIVGSIQNEIKGNTYNMEEVVKSAFKEEKDFDQQFYDFIINRNTFDNEEVVSLDSPVFKNDEMTDDDLSDSHVFKNDEMTDDVLSNSVQSPDDDPEIHAFKNLNKTSLKKYKKTAKKIRYLLHDSNELNTIKSILDAVEISDKQLNQIINGGIQTNPVTTSQTLPISTVVQNIIATQPKSNEAIKQAITNAQKPNQVIAKTVSNKPKSNETIKQTITNQANQKPNGTIKKESKPQVKPDPFLGKHNQMFQQLLNIANQNVDVEQNSQANTTNIFSLNDETQKIIRVISNIQNNNSIQQQTNTAPQNITSNQKIDYKKRFTRATVATQKILQKINVYNKALQTYVITQKTKNNKSTKNSIYKTRYRNITSNEMQQQIAENYKIEEITKQQFENTYLKGYTDEVKEFLENVGIYKQLLFFTKLYDIETRASCDGNLVITPVKSILTENIVNFQKIYFDKLLPQQWIKENIDNFSKLKKITRTRKGKTYTFYRDNTKNTNYKSIASYIQKNKENIFNVQFQMLNYIMTGKTKAHPDNINKTKKISDLIIENNFIIKANIKEGFDELTNDETSLLNGNIENFIGQLVNKNYSPKNKSVLNAANADEAGKAFNEQLKLMKDIYNVADIFFNKPQNQQINYNSDKFIKEAIVNQYVMLARNIQLKTKMSKEQETDLYYNLQDYFINKNSLNLFTNIATKNTPIKQIKSIHQQKPIPHYKYFDYYNDIQADGLILRGGLLFKIAQIIDKTRIEEIKQNIQSIKSTQVQKTTQITNAPSTSAASVSNTTIPAQDNVQTISNIFNEDPTTKELENLLAKKNIQINILHEIYSKTSENYIILDGKEYQIDTNFKKVWFTDNKNKENNKNKEKLNFDINEQIKIGQKSYDAVIYDSYIALIDNDTKEIFKPQHTFGEIQIEGESYRIIEDNDAIRYLVDKTGNMYLCQVQDENDTNKFIIKNINLKQQTKKIKLEEDYVSNFYQKQLIEFQRLYQNPQEQKFMMSLLYSYLSIYKSNKEQMEQIKVNKDKINKIINTQLKTDARDYIGEINDFIAKLRKNNSIFFKGRVFKLHGQENQVQELIKDSYNPQIHNVLYAKEIKIKNKEIIVINKLGNVINGEVSVNININNTFKSKSVNKDEIELKDSIKQLMEDISENNDEDVLTNAVQKFYDAVDKDSTKIDTTTISEFVNILQKEYPNSEIITQYTKIADNKYLEQLIAFEQIEQHLYLENKEHNLFSIKDLQISFFKLYDNQKIDQENIRTILQKKIKENFDLADEMSLYVTDIILKKSIFDRIKMNIINNISLEENIAQPISFKEDIVPKKYTKEQQYYGNKVFDEILSPQKNKQLEKTDVSADEIIKSAEEFFKATDKKVKTNFKKYQIFGAIQAGIQQTIGIGVNQKIRQEQKQQSLYQANTALKYNPSLDQGLEQPNFGMTLFSEDYANNIVSTVISSHGNNFVQDNVVVNLYNNRITRLNQKDGETYEQ